MISRPPVDSTARALTYGTLVAALCLTAGFAIHLAGGDETGRVVSLGGVLVLLATPVAGLVATVVEARHVDPRTALLAVAVLGVLGVAAVLAWIGR